MCVCVCVCVYVCVCGILMFISRGYPSNQTDLSVLAGSLELSYVEMISETALWLLRGERL